MGRLHDAIAARSARPVAGKQMKGIVKTLATPLFAASPFILVLGIGMSTKSWHSSPHTIFQYTPSEDDLVANYAQVVKFAEQKVPSFDSSLSSTREVLKAWAAKFQTGKLGAMPPAFEEEVSEQGPRTEILTAWVHATGNGYRLVNTEFKAAHYQKWMADTRNLICTLESFKYSDTNTVIGADRMESSILEQIQKVSAIKGLGMSFKTQLNELTKEMAPKTDQFQALSKKISVNVADYIHRQKEILDRGGSNDLEEGISTADATSMLDDLRSDTYQEANLALSAQKSLTNRIHRLVRTNTPRVGSFYLASQMFPAGIFGPIPFSLI